MSLRSHSPVGQGAMTLLWRFSPEGGQGIFDFVPETIREIEAIIQIPNYAWNRSGALFCHCGGSRKKVRFPNSENVSYFDPPVRMGEKSFVCAGPDETNRTLYRLEGNQALPIREMGRSQLHSEMDQRKVTRFVPRDTLGIFYPKGEKTVVFDSETEGFFEIDGIVEICHFARSPKSERDRILIVRQTGLYRSSIPRSEVSEAFVWGGAGTGRVEDFVPWILQGGGIPYSIAAAEPQKDDISCVVSVLPEAPPNRGFVFQGLAFDGTVLRLKKIPESGNYAISAPCSEEALS